MRWLLAAPLLLTLGCGGTTTVELGGNFLLRVFFPDTAADDSTRQLDVSIFEEGATLNCDAFIRDGLGAAGRRPDHGVSLNWANGPGGALPDIPKGARPLFFVQGRDDTQRAFLRGCRLAQFPVVEGGAIIEVTLHYLEDDPGASPMPTDGPDPSDEPQPSEEPQPSDDPNPTDRPQASASPRPSDNPASPQPTPAPTGPVPTVTPIPTPRGVQFDCGGVPCPMIEIPAGNFQRGCDNSYPTTCYNNTPLQTVFLDAYLIDETEVTVAQYLACNAASPQMCPPPDTRAGCNGSLETRATHPINCVAWEAMRGYCEWAGKRLPTEAEWEKAARGNDGRIYPWGNDPLSCEHAAVGRDHNDVACEYTGTFPVKTFPMGRSPYGVWDMVGNVTEWLADYEAEDYYRTGPSRNPPGPLSGEERVQRGGAYDDLEPWTTCYARFAQFPDSNGLQTGFRCARSQ